MATNFVKLLPIMAIIINAGYSQTAYNHNQNIQQAKNNKIIINLQNNFWYTIVDVAQAMEISEISDITNEGLVDWNQFNYKGLVQIFLERDRMSIGGEIGFNRLYRWEERYQTMAGYDRWRWGTIWTWHIGALIQLNFANQYYLTTGTGLYTFMNGTGTTVGFPLGIGHIIKFSDFISIPIEFRTNIIFGSGAPITIGGGIGLKFTIWYNFNTIGSNTINPVVKRG